MQEARQKAKGKYPTSPGVVDWDGPEKKGAPPRTGADGENFPDPIISGSSANPREVPAAVETIRTRS